MPLVPVLESKVKAGGLNTGSSLSLPANYGAQVKQTGMADLANAVSDGIQVVQKRANETRIVEAQHLLDNWEASELFHPEKGALNVKGKAAIGMPDQVSKNFDDFAGSVYDTLGNDEQKAVFRKAILTRSGQIRETMLRHERAQMDMYGKEANSAMQSSSTNRAALYYNVPDVVQQSIADARSAARAQGLSDGLPDNAIGIAELDAESNIHSSVLSRLADQAPAEALSYYEQNVNKMNAKDLTAAQKLLEPVRESLKTGQVVNETLSKYQPKKGTDDIISYVMSDLEGGDKVVIDNDGGTAKYGINSNYNTGVDVANLTEEQAKSIYKSKYWDAIGADNLPANMQLVAFDAAVNHGADAHTKSMIEQANGDPRKLIEIRKAYYQELAIKNPKKNGGIYLEGAMNRMAKLEAQLGLDTGVVDFTQRSIDDLYAEAEVKAGGNKAVFDAAKLEIKKAYDARKGTIAQDFDDNLDKALQYTQAGQPVPNTVSTKLRDYDKKALDKLRGNDLEPDLEDYTKIRTAIIAGQPVLDENGDPMSKSQLKVMLGNRYTEVEKLISNPAEYEKARTIESQIASASQAIIGRSVPKSKEDYRTLDTLRQSVYKQIQGIEASSGKSASPDDIQRIMDRNLVSAWQSGFFKPKEKKLFQVGATDEYQVADIPATAEYSIMDAKGGFTPVSYGDLIKELVGDLERVNKKVTPENIQKAYERYQKAGIIQASERG